MTGTGNFRRSRTPPGPAWMFSLPRRYEAIMRLALKNSQSETPTCLKKRIARKVMQMWPGRVLRAGEKTRTSLPRSSRYRV